MKQFCRSPNPAVRPGRNLDLGYAANKLIRSDAEIGLGKHVAPPKSRNSQSSIYVCDFCYFSGTDREAAGLPPLSTEVGRPRWWLLLWVGVRAVRPTFWN